MDNLNRSIIANVIAIVALWGFAAGVSAGGISSYITGRDAGAPPDCPAGPGDTGSSGPGTPRANPYRGNPVHAASGNKFHKEVVYRGAGEFPLEYALYYNSYNSYHKLTDSNHRAIEYPITGRWSTSYSQRISYNHQGFIYSDGGTDTAVEFSFYREDGQEMTFLAEKDELDNFNFPGGGKLRFFESAPYNEKWIYFKEDGFKETYDGSGLLTKIESPTGLAHVITRTDSKTSSVPLKGERLCQAGKMSGGSSSANSWISVNRASSNRSQGEGITAIWQSDEEIDEEEEEAPTFQCTNLGPNYKNWECKEPKWNATNTSYECKAFAHENASCEIEGKVRRIVNICEVGQTCPKPKPWPEPPCEKWSEKIETADWVNTTEIITVTDSYGQSISWPTGYKNLYSYDTTHSLQLKGICDGCTSRLTLPDNREVTFSILNGMIHSISSPLKGNVPKKFLYEVNDNYFTDGGCYITWNCATALTGIIDESGNRTSTWEYVQVEGRPKTSVSYHGEADEIKDYTAIEHKHGMTRKVTSGLGREQTLFFDSRSETIFGVGGGVRLEKVEGQGGTNCKNSTVIYDYDTKNQYGPGGHHRIITITQNPDTTDERRLDYSYDGLGRVEAITEGKGSDLVLEAKHYWDNLGFAQLSHTDFFENYKKYKSVGYTYYPNNRLKQIFISDKTEIGAPHHTKGKVSLVGFTYDYWDKEQLKPKLITVDGPRTDIQDITEYHYNHKGYLREIVNAHKHRVKFESHNWAGRPTTITDERGVAYFIKHQADGVNIDYVSQGGIKLLDYDYFNNGLIKRVTVSPREYYNFKYTSALELKSVTDSEGNLIEYQRSLAAEGEGVEVITTLINSVAQSTDADGAAGSLVYKNKTHYDALGRLYEAFNADVEDYRYEYNYNASGELDLVTRDMGATKGTATVADFEHNSLGQASKKTFDDTTFESYKLNVEGQVISAKDAKGLDTTFLRNGFGQVIERNSPETGKQYYFYDDAGNLVRTEDDDGVVAKYYYSALNQLFFIKYPRNEEENVDLVWDHISKGDLHSIANGSATVVQAKTPNYPRQVTKRSVTYSDADITKTIEYKPAVDADNRGKVVTMTYPSGRHVHLSWLPSESNPNGKLTNISVSATNDSVKKNILSSIAYSPFGPATAWTFGNGLEGGAELGLNYSTNVLSTGVKKLSYERSDGGASIKVTDSNHFFNYFINEKNQLRSGAEGYDEKTHKIFGYNFDKNSNIELITRWLDYPAGSPEAAGSGQTIQTDKNQIEYSETVGRGHILYNDKGQTTNWAKFGAYASDSDYGSFSYNEAGRLKSFSNPASGISASYKYSPGGDRTAKTVSRPSGTETTYYLYGRDGVLIAEFDGSGKVQREYVYWEGRLVAVMLGARPNAGNAVGSIYYVHTDLIGKPLDMTDQNGRVVWSANYEPFGEVTQNSDPDGDGTQVTMPIRFPGQYHDEESGLYYNYYRYYDPKLGRYITADPIGLNGGMNLYAYVGGNPIEYVDPFGLAACYIHYDGYPITIPGTDSSLGLGHAGVLSWNNLTGSTRYYEYGRYRDDFGNVERRVIPDLDIGKDKNPTSESWQKLMDYLSKNNGKDKNISSECDKDADFDKVNDFAEKRKNNPNRQPYSWNPFSPNHCKTFAQDALGAGR